MATRRRRTPTRRTSTRRTSTRRTTRRRSPRTATTLGAGAALLVLGAFLRLTWPWRVAVVLAVLAVLTVYYLWTRRGDIYDEMQATRTTEEEPRE